MNYKQNDVVEINHEQGKDWLGGPIYVKVLSVGDNTIQVVDCFKDGKENSEATPKTYSKETFDSHIK